MMLVALLTVLASAKWSPRSHFLPIRCQFWMKTNGGLSKTWKVGTENEESNPAASKSLPFLKPLLIIYSALSSDLFQDYVLRYCTCFHKNNWVRGHSKVLKRILGRLISWWIDRVLELILHRCSQSISGNCSGSDDFGSIYFVKAPFWNKL